MSTGRRTIRLYLDDVRSPPDDTWTVVRTAEEARALLDDPLVTVEHASLDHDLGECSACEQVRGFQDPQNTCQHRMTGYDLVKWMAEHDVWPVNKPTVHSFNPVGRANMRATIDRYFTVRS